MGPKTFCFLIQFLNAPKSLILILGQWEYGASSSDPNGALKETIRLTPTILPKPKNKSCTVPLPILYRLQRVTHSHDVFWLPGQRQHKKVSPLSSLRNSPELARGKEWPSFASLSPAWEHHLGPPLAAQHKLSRRSLGPPPPSGNSSSSSRAHSWRWILQRPRAGTLPAAAVHP